MLCHATPCSYSVLCYAVLCYVMCVFLAVLQVPVPVSLLAGGGGFTAELAVGRRRTTAVKPLHALKMRRTPIDRWRRLVLVMATEELWAYSP
jgi:hypothetical protein